MNPVRQPRTRKERQVWQAYRELLQDKYSYNEVTTDLLMDKLEELHFARGSRTEVNKYRKTWLEVFYPTGKAETYGPELASLSDPIQQAAASLREQIEQESQKELEQVKKKLSSEIQSLQEKLTEKGLLFDNLLEEYQALQAQQKTTLADNEVLSKQMINQEKVIYGLNEKYDVLTGQLQQAHADNKSLLSNMQDERKQTTQQHQDIINQLQKVHKQDIDDVKGQLERDRHQSITSIDELKVSLMKKEREVVRVEAQLNSSHERLKETQEQLAKKTTEHEAIQMALRDTRQDLVSQQLKLQYQQTENKQLREQNHQQQEATKQLQTELQKMKSMLASIQHDMRKPVLEEEQVA